MWQENKKWGQLLDKWNGETDQKIKQSQTVQEASSWLVNHKILSSPTKGYLGTNGLYLSSLTGEYIV